MRLQIAIVFLAITTLPANAQEREKAVGKGAGLQSCAEFAETYRRSPAQSELLSYSWAQGFMSGLNLMQMLLKRPTHDLNAWSTSDQESHIRGYCNDNPLAYYSDAVQALFEKLPEIPPQSN